MAFIRGGHRCIGTPLCPLAHRTVPIEPISNEPNGGKRMRGLLSDQSSVLFMRRGRGNPSSAFEGYRILSAYREKRGHDELSSRHAVNIPIVGKVHGQIREGALALILQLQFDLKLRSLCSVRSRYKRLRGVILWTTPAFVRGRMAHNTTILLALGFEPERNVIKPKI